LKNITIALLFSAAVFLAGCSTGVEPPDTSVEGCPPGMVNVDGRLCIDTYEYPNREGEYPVVNVDWQTAKGICEDEGKRLCTEREWVFACGSGRGNTYPYGNDARDACNTSQGYDGPETKDGKEEDDFKEIDIPVGEFMEQFESNVLSMDPDTVSERNAKLLDAMYLYLALHRRIAAAKDIQQMLVDAGVDLRRGGVGEDLVEDFLVHGGLMGDGPDRVKEEIGKIEKNGGSDKTKKKLLKEYKSKVNEIAKLENGLGASTIEGGMDGEDFEKIVALREMQYNIMAALVAQSPDNIIDINRTHLSVAEDNLKELTEKIYNENIRDLDNDDLSQIKHELIPAMEERGVDRFPLYFYALQRKLTFQYDPEKKVLTLKQSDLPAGVNSDCVTEQGVFDMVGNVWEWTGTAEKDATYRGGDSNEGSGTHFKQCAPLLGAVQLKPPAYRSQYIGLRCCWTGG